ncbi:MAG: dihydrofolate reductase family protein [Nocardioidaceae bacterium]
MRKLMMYNTMSLNGVYQSPFYVDEDATSGFTYGGWANPYLDNAAMEWFIDNVSRAGGFLLGRRTYEIFAAHWPSAPEDQQVLAEPMNRLPKFVASATLTEPLKWQNSRLLPDDTPEAVRQLKHDDGADLRIIGSAQLLNTLIQHDLVDEFHLMIDPVIVSGGKRLFTDNGQLTRLRLVDNKVTTTGAIIATYTPASD